MDCARAIVQAGLSELVAFQPDLEHPTWGQDFRLALELFEEVALDVRWYEVDVKISRDEGENTSGAV